MTAEPDEQHADGDGQCDHGNSRIIKRARESHEAPEWENKIIGECRDCGEYWIE